IQEHVRGAEYAEFPAAHLSNVQAGAAFSDLVLAFLNAQ
ncbi:3-oxoadipate enol-lactonase, partial [Pseudonocardia sp. EV170527-09]